jgi:hypothetical protein
MRRPTTIPPPFAAQNGSSIRPWWIVHHYLSALMSVLMLTWPADSQVQASFLPSFTGYFIYQGFVQFAQARYQRARHYALRALGKATSMDVVHTETLHEFHAGLWVIVVLVVVAQAWQVVNGVQLFSVLVQQLSPLQPWYNFREELQCAALGALFVFVGVANFVTTVQVRACARRRPARAPPRAATPQRAALTAPHPPRRRCSKKARAAGATRGAPPRPAPTRRRPATARAPTRTTAEAAPTPCRQCRSTRAKRTNDGALHRRNEPQYPSLWRAHTASSPLPRPPLACCGILRLGPLPAPPGSARFITALP